MPATDGTVYLTNGSVSDPFVVFDTYDWRSVIENGIFKEGKHPWHLGKFPKKIEAAVVVHCHFTLLVMGLCTAFRLGQAKPEAAPTDEMQTYPSLSTALLGGEGMAGFRLRRKRGKSRQGHHLCGGGLWHFLSGRTGHLDWYASASSPLSAWLSPRHPSALWH